MKITNLKQFTALGMSEFESFLEKAKEGSQQSIPDDLLESEKYTRTIDEEHFLEQRTFQSKKKFVDYLSDNLPETFKKDYYNREFWTYLTAFYFESICPMEGDFRKVSKNSKYILNTGDWNRYYRHLIATPMRLKRELGKLADIYLNSLPHQHGEIIEQLASRQGIATVPSIIGAVKELYWDEVNQNLKKGVFAKEKDKPGTLRRFIIVIQQFELTYDLLAMNSHEIVALLPKEFNHWKESKKLSV